MIARGACAVGVVLLAVLVGGCSDEASAPSRSATVTVTPTATASSSSSPTASPSPTLPATAREATRAGAQAFAAHFFAVYNYAFWNADPAPIQSISDSGCVYCNSMISTVETIRAQGAHVEGGRIKVVAAVAKPGEPNDRIVVNLLLNQGAARTLTSDGRVLDDAAAVTNGRVDVATRWRDGHWILLAAHLLKPGES